MSCVTILAMDLENRVSCLRLMLRCLLFFAAGAFLAALPCDLEFTLLMFENGVDSIESDVRAYVSVAQSEDPSRLHTEMKYTRRLLVLPHHVSPY